MAALAELGVGFAATGGPAVQGGVLGHLCEADDN
jgi:hypothetical protein